MILAIGITTALGFYLAWTVGANDFANSMGDAVGSGALSVKKAVVLGALFEVAGSVLAGSHVTETIRKGVVDPAFFASAPGMLALGMICSMLAAAVWVHIASLAALPVSTTHSIVGALAGFGVAASGLLSVRWGRLGGIALSWVICPVAGGLLAYVLFKLLVRFALSRPEAVRASARAAPVVVFAVVTAVSASILYNSRIRWLRTLPVDLTRGAGTAAAAAALGLLTATAAGFLLTRRIRSRSNLSAKEELRLVESIFTPLVIFTSLSVAFSHGANDVANAIGPVAAVLEILRTGEVALQVATPLWLLLLGGGGIVLGLSTFGYKVMKTIGTRITQLTPSRGVIADLATVCVVLTFTVLGIPVSTTHTIVGAVIGIGLARGLGAVDRRVIRDILASWFVTVPVSGALSAGFFLLGKLARLDEAISTLF